MDSRDTVVTKEIKTMARSIKSIEELSNLELGTKLKLVGGVNWTNDETQTIKDIYPNHIVLERVNGSLAFMALTHQLIPTQSGFLLVCKDTGIEIAVYIVNEE